uniref:IS1634 family transposase n=1 Tax=Micromonospora craniellae TaxID=2294034 RepID=UPI0018F1B084|nr:hypothetical protein [Micromonospora craniellae]
MWSPVRWAGRGCSTGCGAGASEADAALARQGRYATVAENLQVKEVNIDTDDRFVICYNPEAADRDAAVRTRLIAQLTDLIDDTDRLPATKRAELRGVISTKPGLNRFLRVTPKGLLRLDQAKVKAEQRLDGKHLPRCSDPTLSAEDIALGYKQLLEVERGWRDMKTTLDLRPVFHRREDRIRAHILLCWLALLLIRVAETETGRTWTTIRTEIDRLHLVLQRRVVASLRRLVRPHHPRDGRRRVPRRHPRRRSLEGGITADAGSLIPLTSNEVRRLFAHLVLIGRTAAEHVLHWSTWRRRRQAQAKASHYRKRLEPP